MGIGAKALLGLILIAILGAIAWDLKTTHEKVGELEGTIKTQSAEIARLNKAALTITAARKLDDAAQVSIAAESQTARDQTTVIKERSKDAVAEIKKKHPKANAPAILPVRGDSVPATDLVKLWDTEVERQSEAKIQADQISLVRITAIWDSFCLSVPTNPQCLLRVAEPAPLTNTGE